MTKLLSLLLSLSSICSAAPRWKTPAQLLGEMLGPLMPQYVVGAYAPAGGGGCTQALVSSSAIIGVFGPPATTASINSTGANLLVAAISYSTGATLLSVSDNKGNTWTPLTVQGVTGQGQTQIYYVNSHTPAVGTGHTFTFTFTGPTVRALATLYTFSGVTTGTLDVSNGGNASASPVSTGSTGTLAGTCEVVFTSFTGNGVGGTGIGVTGAAFTAQTTAGFWDGGFAYVIPSATTAITASWAITGDSQLGASIAAFK